MDRTRIAANVRVYRQAKGFTQQELARRSMTCAGTIYLIERGRPSHLNTLRRVARALGVKVRALEAEMATGDDQAA